MKLIILPKAERELEQAIDYYESQRPGLGIEFIREFNLTTRRIEEFPEAWHPMDDEYRRCQFGRFPYAIVYRIDSERNEAFAIAVMHMHRDPSAWRDEL